MIANEGTYQALVIDDEYQVREFVSDVLRGEIFTYLFNLLCYFCYWHFH